MEIEFVIGTPTSVARLTTSTMFEKSHLSIAAKEETKSPEVYLNSYLMFVQALSPIGAAYIELDNVKVILSLAYVNISGYTATLGQLLVHTISGA